MNLNPTILLLREGTDQSQGKAQIVSNINACQSVVEIVKTTLGPRGMDKMIQSGRGTVISNDGATIMALLDIVHPAAKLLVDIAQSQDCEVGDGTTSVTILAGELLKEAKGFVEDGLNSQVIIAGFKEALQVARQRLEELAVDIDVENRRECLLKCAMTSLNSKLLSSYKEHFAELVVSAVEKLDPQLLDKDLVGVKMVTGGSITDSFMVDGVAFKKTFSYAGFEQQQKKFTTDVKICLLNLELELKSEKENAEIRLEKPEEYQAIVDAEWKIIYQKLDKIVASGAKIILSKLPIGDLATQYFADRGLFCAGRVGVDDLKRVAKATGGVIQTTVNGLQAEVLGTCGEFEEKQVGAERYNMFINCPLSKTSTIILRGGAEQFIAEAERSLNDAIMIVRRAMKASKIVPGGGAIEMELSKHLRNYARSISGKNQVIVNAFAKSLETIPRNIADNAGLDSVDVLNRLRQKHSQDNQQGHNYGVDIHSPNGIGNTYDLFVWEPIVIKRNALAAATEAACTILSIDETVKNPAAEQEKRAKQGGKGGKNPMSLQGLAKTLGGR